MPDILLIEDNPDIAELVALHLADIGADVQRAGDGETGLGLARSRPFDLVILDLMLPGIDGLEVCKQLRHGERHIPVLMLTAKGAEFDRVLGLELGADDYLTKPFSIRELVARVKAILRRVAAGAAAAPADAASIVRIGALEVDGEKRTVSLDDGAVELTAREFDLLWHFIQHPGRVFTRSQLLDAVWGYGHDGYEHTVNSHINRLRAKLERDPAHPQYILTVWGVGYKFADPARDHPG